MEVRPGYKWTDIGLIPKDWAVKSLGDLRPFVTSGSRGWATFYSDRGSLFVRITNMSRDSIYLDLENPKFVNLSAESSEGIRTQLQEHDVLISITADIGIVSYVDSRIPIPAYINQHIALVRFDKAKTCGKFVSYFLASEKPQKLFRASTDTGAKAGMSLPTVQKIEIALPILPEQRAIAAALSDMDALLGGLERLIAKKRDLKQAVMQQLLTGQTRLPGFSGQWNIKRLGDLATIRDGTHQTPKYVASGIPFFSVEHVTSGDFKNTKYISEQEHRFLTRSVKIEKGDILMTRIGSIGDCKLIDWDVDASFYVSLALLKIKPGYLAAYIAHYTKSAAFQMEVELHSLQSAIPRKINLGPISNVKVELPDTIAEQAAIAAVLSDMDAELSALVARRDKTCDLKQAMMQELLTGRTRLV